MIAKTFIIEEFGILILARETDLRIFLLAEGTPRDLTHFFLEIENL